MPMKARIEGTPSSSGRPPALLTDQHDILKSTPHPVCLYFHTKETDFLTKATLRDHKIFIGSLAYGIIIRPSSCVG